MALLLRTLHWQRRQYCTLVCNMIVPPVVLILLAVLNRVIKPQAFSSSPFELIPKGGFVARPFDPAACFKAAARGMFQGNSDLSFDKCASNPFRPQYSVPVYAPPEIEQAVGSHDANNAGEQSGLLSSLSLDPFIYPPATDPDSLFAKSQTAYDGVFLHSYFDGDIENLTYQAIAKAARDRKMDSLYNSTTVKSSSPSAFRSLIYNSWFEGGSFNPYSTALQFDSFSQDSNADGGLSVSATIFYNESSPSNCTEFCPLVSNVVRTYSAIYQQLEPDRSAFAFLRRMPRVDPFESLGIIPLVISVIIAQLTHFLLPSFLRLLVLERVGRMRYLMASMGLDRSRYFVGTYLSLLIIYLISALIITLVGLAANIPFFQENTPVAYLVLFFIWYVPIASPQLPSFPFRASCRATFLTFSTFNCFPIVERNRGNVLVAFALFLEPFFGDPETAQIFGWFYIVIVNLVGAPYVGRQLSDIDTSEGKWAAIMLLPSFAYMRSVFYAGAINSGGKGVTISPTMYKDVELGMCHGEGPFCRSYIFLIVEWFILLLLGAYFDRILSRSSGGRLHPLFFLGFQRKSILPEENDDMHAGEKGSDVIEEELRAQTLVENMESNPFDGVVLHQLSKTYHARKPVHALKNLSLVARRNDVMCILAHNGAGKTTAFRTLVGELDATAGTAFVNGHSIVTDIESVHCNLGVAAQQDILWDVMSAQEHLFFYGRVKNLSGAELKAAVDDALESVQLSFARKRKVRALSGGMKRRLSVSIAMMGQPNFIVLDEPSSGLDILARQKLWNAIDRMKKDKVVLLTTHSLEEAEALSTRVAIMSEGELKCVGTAEDLKLRLGKGHRLMVSLPVSKLADLHAAIIAFAPDASLETVVGGNVEYVLPRDVPISTVFAVIGQRRGDLQVRDWAINQSSLEDVFLKVTRSSHSHSVNNVGLDAV